MVNKLEGLNLIGFENFVQSLTASLTGLEIFLLSGDVGAGKTQFVSFFTKALGLSEAASPTYALHHRYKNEKWVLDHYDLYRVEDESDLVTLGIFEVMQESSLLCIEWPQNMNLDDLPFGRIIYDIKISKVPGDPNLRNLEIIKKENA